MFARERWAMVAIAALAGLIGGWISSWVFVDRPVFAEQKLESRKVITAQEFRVVDMEGKAISTWGASASGGPQLSFSDSAGKKRALFGMLDDRTPGFSFLGKEGAAQAELRVGSMGHPSLKLHDVKGNKIALLGAHGLGLFNQTLRGRLVLTRDGILNLDLTDQETHISSTLMILTSDRPTVALMDQGGKIIWSAP